MDFTEIVKALDHLRRPIEGRTIIQHQLAEDRINVGQLLDACGTVQQGECVVAYLEQGAHPRAILFSSPMQPEVLNILLDSTQAALTLIVISDEPRLQSLLRVFRDNPSKQALFQAVIEDEIRNSSEMLAGGQNASGDQLEQCLRNYLSTFHVLHPEEGCVLPALGGEITRAEPEVRVAVEKGLKQI